MEMLTDIMAIIGWSLFGIFASEFNPRNLPNEYVKITCISFGLIAASLVLG